MGKTLVTGALGNVGRYAAEYAIKSGQEVRVAGPRPEMLKSRYKSDAEIVYFDFKDIKTFDAALNGVDRVFIMRPPQLGKPTDLKPFVEALKEKGGMRLVVFLSLMGIEHNPVPPHYKIEKYIENAKLPYCHIRPSFFMQNISGVHAFEIKHFDRIVVPAKNAHTSLIDAEDIGELIAKVLSEPDRHLNRGYSITGPEAINYWQVQNILSEELNRTITYINPKPSFSKKYWVDVRGLDKEYVSVMSKLYLMTRLGAAKKITNTFEAIMKKKPQSFRCFVKKNQLAWS